MKSLLLFCSILCLSTMMVAQNGSEKRMVQILADSELTITGDTNINKFLCGYDPKLLERSKEITYTQHDNTLKFQNAVLTLNNQGFDCGNKAINKDFHSLLRTNEYPTISLEITELTVQTPTHALAEVKITIAGKNKNYTLPVKIVDSPVDCFTGTLELDINDFGLKPPKKMFGLIVVQEDIKINFNLTIKK